jgi:nucleoside permease NupC
MLYAMRGFANFGWLGIMIAGLSTVCQESSVARSGTRSTFALTGG